METRRSQLWLCSPLRLPHLKTPRVSHRASVARTEKEIVPRAAEKMHLGPLTRYLSVPSLSNLRGRYTFCVHCVH